MLPPESERQLPIPPPIERKQSLRVRSKLPMNEIVCTEKASVRKPPSRTKSLPRPTQLPFHESPIIRGFHQVYIAPERGDDDVRRQLKERHLETQSCFSFRSIFASPEQTSARNARHPISLSAAKRIGLRPDTDPISPPQKHKSSPVQQVPRRTKSCLSSRSLRSLTEESPVGTRTRTVSFGRVEGVVIPNIACDNKDALWFSRDEYRSMRQEAMEMAHVNRRQGTRKESNEVTSRGLEKFTEKKSTQLKAARISVLEHRDLAMYVLASNHSIRTARQLAQMDALDAIAIQKESPLDQLPRRRIRLNP